MRMANYLCTTYVIQWYYGRGNNRRYLFYRMVNKYIYMQTFYVSLNSALLYSANFFVKKLHIFVESTYI